MTNIRNALMQAAGTAASDDSVYVEDVFSTHLYTGTGSGITINNGIDLSGEGGLVIYRRRDGAENWSYQDTVRGVDSVIYSDSNGAAANPGGYGLASFNANGFTTELNTSSAEYCSWTFRKQEGFFDIVQYTGNGSNAPSGIGQSLFTSSGTFTVPSGVTKMAVLCVGGGGSGGWDSGGSFVSSTTGGGGGGGGALAWANINCTAGQTFAVTVGSGGSTGYNQDGSAGGNSSVVRNSDSLNICTANGGSGGGRQSGLGGNGSGGAGGTRSYGSHSDILATGGGNGGNGGSGSSYYEFPDYYVRQGAGGGAGGYSGNGGYGASGGGGTGGSGAGGGGAGGSTTTSGNAFNGGGVGQYGEGTSGSGVSGDDGNGGSGGAQGASSGGAYGGGGKSNAGAGGAGYVRIVYTTDTSNTPEFPSTNVYDYTVSNVLSHNLGCKPGMIIIKMLTESGYAWRVWHKSVASSNGSNYSLSLNSTAAAANGSSSAGGYWNHTAPTSTNFTVGNYGQVNNNGSSFIAYLFADGDESDAQIFGEDGDEKIVKCGTFTTSSTWGIANAECGFEPQWLMYKRTDDTEDWQVIDNMRGCGTQQGKWNGTDDGTQYSSVSASNDQVLKANTSAAEANEGRADFHSTGFSVATGGTNDTYVYIAIRRPMKEPDTNTDVLGITTATTTAPLWKTGNTVDLGFYKYTSSSDVNLSARLLVGKQLKTNTTAAATSDGTFLFDYQTGFYNNTFNSSSYIGYGLRRYPKVFDMVVYTGTGSNTTHAHNLGVVPELMIIKRMESSANWFVYESNGGKDKYMFLDGVDQQNTSSNIFGNTPTTTTIVTNPTNNYINESGGRYLALLFASLNGISKVGTYTGTGSDINVTGLGAAARFVLIKRTDTSGDWYVFDTTQGIASGNDPYWFMNGNTQVTGTDYIDPHSSGFTITSSAPAALNASGGTYIYLAFA